MYFLDEIIEQINSKIKSSLNGKNYQKAEFRGIAETIYRSTGVENQFEQLPCVIDNAGQKVISPDDNYSMLVYYKIPSEIYTPVRSFGDSNDTVKCMVDVSMLIYAFREEIERNSRQLNAELIDALPIALKLIDEGKEMKVSIQTVATNYQTKQLLEREFGTEHVYEFLQPENYFFEIKIKIESTYQKGCFSNCNC